ncbi:MAG: MYXO-CTERM domain-containing protein, partial [Bradymonadia bacterium]
QPYLDNGSVFVALKLLPGAGIDDITPVRLDFSAGQPTVPIIPTQVAAEPDMGLIVHVIGDARAIATNYLHVEINERAIDWFNFGSNYADVVSQAADEANGQAFATDFAGAITDAHRSQLRLDLISDGTLNAIRMAGEFSEVFRELNTVDEDLIVALSAVIEPPEGVTVRDMVNNWFDYEQHPVNGAAIAAVIEDDVNPGRVKVNALFDGERYMSRLYTTLSADEMTADPLFAQNGDLDAVDNIRTAIFRDAGCFTGDGQMIFSDGSRMPIFDGGQAGLIQRQAGETVRGLETRGAALVERMMSAGQPEVIRDDPGTSMQTNPPVSAPPRGEDDSGCGGCATDGHAPMAPIQVFGLGLLGLGLLVLRRRR